MWCMDLERHGLNGRSTPGPTAAGCTVPARLVSHNCFGSIPNRGEKAHPIFGRKALPRRRRGKEQSTAGEGEHLHGKDKRIAA